MGVDGRMGLPLHIDRVSLSHMPDLTEGRLYALVTPHADQGGFDAAVVDTAGKRYVELIGYRTVALPNTVDAEPLRAMHAAIVAVR